MNMQDIEDQKTREINQATAWFIRRRIAGEPQDFPEPGFVVKMELAQSIANRLKEIEVPEPLAREWASVCGNLEDVAREMTELGEWFGGAK